MSWLFSRALAEAFWPPTYSDGELSAPLKLNPTPQAYLWRDKTTKPSRRSRSGLTSVPLTDDLGAALLTSYLEGSRAKISPPQGKAQGLTEAVQSSGSRCCASSTKCSPASSLSRIAPCSGGAVLALSSPAFPKQGIMQHGQCWELMTSERRTSGKGSGSLRKIPDGKTFFHTPNTHGMDGGSNGRKALRKRQKVEWLTPTATDGKRCAFKLESLAKHWDKKPRANLAEQIAHLSEPQTLTPELARGGALNPEWVEWLMGWPTKWSGLNALEMDKFLSWRQQFLLCFTGGSAESVLTSPVGHAEVSS